MICDNMNKPTITDFDNYNNIGNDFDDYENISEKIIKIIIYTNKLNDYSNLLKFFNKEIENGKNNYLENIGNYYEYIEKKMDIANDYYLKFFELTNDLKIIEKIVTYYENNYDYEQVMKYLKIGIDGSNTYSIIQYGLFCFEIEDYDKMKIWYDLAEEKGDTNIYYHYCIYYLQIKDYDNMIIYAKKGILINDVYCMRVISNYYKEIDHGNIFKFYKFLLDFENKNLIITYDIQQLEKDPIIIKYKLKLSNIENNPNIKSCIVCYENNSHISFDCGHEICVMCYCSMKKCYYNCNYNCKKISLTYTYNHQDNNQN